MAVITLESNGNGLGYNVDLTIESDGGTFIGVAVETDGGTEVAELMIASKHDIEVFFDTMRELEMQYRKATA